MTAFALVLATFGMFGMSFMAWAASTERRARVVADSKRVSAQKAELAMLDANMALDERARKAEAELYAIRYARSEAGKRAAVTRRTNRAAKAAGGNT